MDRLMNRRVAVSVLVAVFVMVGLASPAIAPASSDAVLVLHFDEGSGTIVKDESGHGNDGTIYGATWVDGKYGKALSFDGRDDYVSVADDPILDFGANDFTYEFWVNFNDVVSYASSLLDYREGDKVFAFYYVGSSRHSGCKSCWELRVSDGTGWTPALIDSYLRGDTFWQRQHTINTWYHIALVRNNNIYSVYVDGTALSDTFTDTDVVPDFTTERRIGYAADNTIPFNGKIDEVRIYDRALTADEIKTHYEGKQSELTLTKSASPSTIEEGEPTTISIKIENTGMGDAKSIEVKDTVPMGFKIIDGAKEESFDKIKSGDYRTVEYTLRATESGKITCDPATATYKDADGNSYSAASNSVSVRVGREVPVGADSDGDGWSDEKEREMGTNPYSVDSDSDGLKDPEDPNPTVPEEKKTPGFEAVFAITGLLAVAYLLRRRR